MSPEWNVKGQWSQMRKAAAAAAFLVLGNLIQCPDQTTCCLRRRARAAAANRPVPSSTIDAGSGTALGVTFTVAVKLPDSP